MSIVFTQGIATLQYLRVAVSATVNGASYNPTVDVVQFGFQPEATYTASEAPSTWYSGSWETVGTGAQVSYVAKCLVGPGGTFAPTAPVDYWVWIKITDSPEIPVLFVGELQVV